MEDDTTNNQFPRWEPQLMCPWVSAAPIGCTSTTKAKQMPTNMNMFIQQQVNHQTMKKHKFKTPKQNQQHQQRPVDTANHFYYFLKLMQTFPDVHPATLHSVMCLCNHNFSAAIETLITAKNYKETYMHRKMMSNVRHHPYQTQQTKHLQAQTSNGQLYDIVSVVSENNMPNIEYSVRNDTNEVIIVDTKKISQDNNGQEEEMAEYIDEKVVVETSEEVAQETTNQDLNTDESIECNGPVDDVAIVSTPSNQEDMRKDTVNLIMEHELEHKNN